MDPSSAKGTLLGDPSIAAAWWGPAVGLGTAGGKVQEYFMSVLIPHDRQNTF